MSTLHITQAIQDALKAGNYPNLTSYELGDTQISAANVATMSEGWRLDGDA